MPKSQRRTPNVEEVEFGSLFHRFGNAYGHDYVRLAAELRESYPEITKPGRRTGRALRNICFFAWSSCRDADPALIPALFHAAVLLAAQDDYYDNPRIPAAQKESLCAATNHALRNNGFEVFGWDADPTPQVRDLVSLWSYVAGTIPRSAPLVRSYWVETACQMNDAMAAENRAVRRTSTYEEYMRTAVLSIGMVFIWATYLAHDHVSLTAIRALDPVLVHGARAVRLSNDMAGHRQHRKKENAVTLIGGSGPGARILRLLLQESRAFREGVVALDVEPQVRGVLLNSLDFLREFYQRSDFDLSPDW